MTKKQLSVLIASLFVAAPGYAQSVPMKKQFEARS